MITAIDTNVLLDVLLPDPKFVGRSKAALIEADRAGKLIVCTQVYSELCVHFKRQTDCDLFLSDGEISVEAPDREVCWLASQKWKDYRRAGGKRNRILADFLIAAHAQVRAARLLSRDRGFYQTYFKDLTLVDPVRP